MEYIIVKNDAFDSRPAYGNIEWDATHFQPASTLTAEERAKFGVVELAPTSPPAFDAETHKAVEGTPAKINGVWSQTWDIVALSPAELAALHPPVILDGGVFLARLTDTEYARIMGAAQAALAQGNAQMARWVEQVRLQGHVNLSSDEVTTAKSALVQAGLMTQDRVTVVFAAS